jgi:hypothetical protein
MKFVKFPSVSPKFSLVFVSLLAIALFTVVWAPRTQAQMTINLQADINDLRSQIGALRSEVALLRQQRGYSPAPAPALPSTRRARSPELTDRQMLDRLAILAIEAKDRLNALEARVSKIESRVR